MKIQKKGMLIDKIVRINEDKMRIKQKYIWINERGGLTVEATLAFPIYILCIVMFVYILQAYYVYGNINIAMYGTARELSGKLYESNNIRNEEIDKKVRSLINKGACNAVYNGINGIDMSMSYYDSDKDEMILKSRYNMNMPFNIFGMQFRMGNNIVMRGWNGNRELVSNKNFVYITKKGKVYHTDIECSYLTVKKVAVFRSDIDGYRNESGGKYYECKTCKNEKSGEYVYITKYGESYHNVISCSSITRCIIPIDIHELDGRDKCEKCCRR